VTELGSVSPEGQQESMKISEKGQRAHLNVWEKTCKRQQYHYTTHFSNVGCTHPILHSSSCSYNFITENTSGDASILRCDTASLD